MQASVHRVCACGRVRAVVGLYWARFHVCESLPFCGSLNQTFDPASTPGHGLLGEMSLVEVTERAALQAAADAAELELKKQRIQVG